MTMAICSGRISWVLARVSVITNIFSSVSVLYAGSSFGILIGTGKSGTVLGSGLVQYTAIYARWQYYRTSQTRPYDANRGGKWFERMKAAHKEDIMNGAKKILGGGSI